MEERVATFMNECTSLSDTTYPPLVIKTLVQSKYEQDINDFCKIVLEDIEDMSVEEIKDYLRKY